MTKINRYKLKDVIATSDLIKYHARSGGTWINKEADVFFSKVLYIQTYRHTKAEISVEIAFKRDLQDWNDFDNILVCDEDFCQPYTPFYSYLDGQIESFPFLDTVIQKYNEYMNSIDLFEKIE